MKDEYGNDPYLTQARIDTWINSQPHPDMGHIIRHIGNLVAASELSNSTDVDMAAVGYGNVDPREVEVRQKLLSAYDRFASVADAINPDPIEPWDTPLPEGVSYLDRGSFFHAFLYADKAGDKHVIKIPREISPQGRLYTFEGTTHALVRAYGNDAFEQIEAMSHKNQRFITHYEEGGWVAELTSEQLARVPREHMHALGANIKDSFKRNLVLDIYGTDNFKYSPEKGFIFIDPHNAAEYTDSPDRRVITVSNIIRRLSAPADAVSGLSPATTAIRLRLVEELVSTFQPDTVDLTQIQDLLDALQSHAEGATPPPWPSPTNKSATSADSFASSSPENSLVVQRGNKIMNSLDELPFNTLRTTANDLAQLQMQLHSVLGATETIFPEQLAGGQEHLANAVEALTIARSHLYAYLTAIGLGHLISSPE